MKSLFLRLTIYITLLINLLLGSCIQNDKGLFVETRSLYYNDVLYDTLFEISSADTTVKFVFTARAPWTLGLESDAGSLTTDSDMWVVPDMLDGKTLVNIPLTIYVERNVSLEARDIYLMLNTVVQDATIMLHIVQQGGDGVEVPGGGVITYDGQQLAHTITSQQQIIPFLYSTTEPVVYSTTVPLWVTLPDPAEVEAGVGLPLDIDVGFNSASDSREGVVTITASGGSQLDISITQQGGVITYDGTTDFVAEAEGETLAFDFNSSEDFNVTTTYDWIELVLAPVVSRSSSTLGSNQAQGVNGVDGATSTQQQMQQHIAEPRAVAARSAAVSGSGTRAVVAPSVSSASGTSMRAMGMSGSGVSGGVVLGMLSGISSGMGSGIVREDEIISVIEGVAGDNSLSMFIPVYVGSTVRRGTVVITPSIDGGGSAVTLIIEQRGGKTIITTKDEIDYEVLIVGETIDFVFKSTHLVSYELVDAEEDATWLDITGNTPPAAIDPEVETTLRIVVEENTSVAREGEIKITPIHEFDGLILVSAVTITVSQLRDGTLVLVDPEDIDITVSSDDTERDIVFNASNSMMVKYEVLYPVDATDKMWLKLPTPNEDILVGVGGINTTLEFTFGNNDTGNDRQATVKITPKLFGSYTSQQAIDATLTIDFTQGREVIVSKTVLPPADVSNFGAVDADVITVRYTSTELVSYVLSKVDDAFDQEPTPAWIAFNAAPTDVTTDDIDLDMTIVFNPGFERKAKVSILPKDEAFVNSVLFFEVTQLRKSIVAKDGQDIDYNNSIVIDAEGGNTVDVDGEQKPLVFLFNSESKFKYVTTEEGTDDVVVVTDWLTIPTDVQGATAVGEANYTELAMSLTANNGDPRSVDIVITPYNEAGTTPLDNGGEVTLTISQGRKVITYVATELEDFVDVAAIGVGDDAGAGAVTTSLAFDFNTTEDVEYTLIKTNSADPDPANWITLDHLSFDINASGTAVATALNVDVLANTGDVLSATIRITPYNDGGVEIDGSYVDIPINQLRKDIIYSRDDYTPDETTGIIELAPATAVSSATDITVTFAFNSTAAVSYSEVTADGNVASYDWISIPSTLLSNKAVGFSTVLTTSNDNILELTLEDNDTDAIRVGYVSLTTIENEEEGVLGQDLILKITQKRKVITYDDKDDNTTQFTTISADGTGAGAGVNTPLTFVFNSEVVVTASVQDTDGTTLDPEWVRVTAPVFRAAGIPYSLSVTVLANEDIARDAVIVLTPTVGDDVTVSDAIEIPVHQLRKDIIYSRDDYTPDETTGIIELAPATAVSSATDITVTFAFNSTAAVSYSEVTADGNVASYNWISIPSTLLSNKAVGFSTVLTTSNDNILELTLKDNDTDAIRVGYVSLTTIENEEEGVLGQELILKITQKRKVITYDDTDDNITQFTTISADGTGDGAGVNTPLTFVFNSEVVVTASVQDTDGTTLDPEWVKVTAPVFRAAGIPYSLSVTVLANEDIARDVVIVLTPTVGDDVTVSDAIEIPVHQLRKDIIYSRDDYDTDPVTGFVNLVKANATTDAVTFAFNINKDVVYAKVSVDETTGDVTLAPDDYEWISWTDPTTTIASEGTAVTLTITLEENNDSEASRVAYVRLTTGGGAASQELILKITQTRKLIASTGSRDFLTVSPSGTIGIGAAGVDEPLLFTYDSDVRVTTEVASAADEDWIKIVGTGVGGIGETILEFDLTANLGVEREGVIILVPEGGNGGTDNVILNITQSRAVVIPERVAPDDGIKYNASAAGTDVGKSITFRFNSEKKFRYEKVVVTDATGDTEETNLSTDWITGFTANSDLTIENATVGESSYSTLSMNVVKNIGVERYMKITLMPYDEVTDGDGNFTEPDTRQALSFIMSQGRNVISTEDPTVYDGVDEKGVSAAGVGTGDKVGETADVVIKFGFSSQQIVEYVLANTEDTWLRFTQIKPAGRAAATSYELEISVDSNTYIPREGIVNIVPQGGSNAINAANTIPITVKQGRNTIIYAPEELLAQTVIAKGTVGAGGVDDFLQFAFNSEKEVKYTTSVVKAGDPTDISWITVVDGGFLEDSGDNVLEMKITSNPNPGIERRVKVSITPYENLNTIYTAGNVVNVIVTQERNVILYDEATLPIDNVIADGKLNAEKLQFAFNTSERVVYTKEEGADWIMFDVTEAPVTVVPGGGANLYLTLLKMNISRNQDGIRDAKVTIMPYRDGAPLEHEKIELTIVQDAPVIRYEGTNVFNKKPYETDVKFVFTSTSQGTILKSDNMGAEKEYEWIGLSTTNFFAERIDLDITLDKNLTGSSRQGYVTVKPINGSDIDYVIIDIEQEGAYLSPATSETYPIAEIVSTGNNNVEFDYVINSSEGIVAGGLYSLSIDDAEWITDVSSAKIIGAGAQTLTMNILRNPAGVRTGQVTIQPLNSSGQPELGAENNLVVEVTQARNTIFYSTAPDQMVQFSDVSLAGSGNTPLEFAFNTSKRVEYSAVEDPASLVEVDWIKFADDNAGVTGGDDAAVTTMRVNIVFNDEAAREATILITPWGIPVGGTVGDPDEALPDEAIEIPVSQLRNIITYDPSSPTGDPLEWQDNPVKAVGTDVTPLVFNFNSTETVTVQALTAEGEEFNLVNNLAWLSVSDVKEGIGLFAAADYNISIEVDLNESLEREAMVRLSAMPSNTHLDILISQERPIIIPKENQPTLPLKVSADGKLLTDYLTYEFSSTEQVEWEIVPEDGETVTPGDDPLAADWLTFVGTTIAGANTTEKLTTTIRMNIAAKETADTRLATVRITSSPAGSTHDITIKQTGVILTYIESDVNKIIHEEIAIMGTEGTDIEFEFNSTESFKYVLGGAGASEGAEGAEGAEGIVYDMFGTSVPVGVFDKVPETSGDVVTLSFAVLANTGQKREGTITITPVSDSEDNPPIEGAKRVVITVTQLRAVVIPTAGQDLPLVIGSQGGSELGRYTFTTTEDLYVELEVSDPVVDWITDLPTEVIDGDNTNKSFTMSVALSNSIERNANILLQTSDDDPTNPVFTTVHIISVKQLRASVIYDVADLDNNISATGGNINFLFDAEDATVAISSGSRWITLIDPPVDGTEERKLRMEIAEYTGSSDRDGIVTITVPATENTLSTSIDIKVKQSGKALDYNPSNNPTEFNDVVSTGASYTFKYNGIPVIGTTGTVATITTSVNWIDLGEGGGVEVTRPMESNQRLTLEVLPNTSTSPRLNAIITIKAPSGEVLFLNVSQVGAVISYNENVFTDLIFEPNLFGVAVGNDAENAGNEYNFTYQTLQPITYSSDKAWILLPSNPTAEEIAAGNVYFSFGTETNTDSESRTGTITLTPDVGSSLELTITQSGPVIGTTQSKNFLDISFGGVSDNQFVFNAVDESLPVTYQVHYPEGYTGVQWIRLLDAVGGAETGTDGQDGEGTTQGDNTLVFNVTQNINIAREATITITPTAPNQNQSMTVNVSQEESWLFTNDPVEYEFTKEEMRKQYYKSHTFTFIAKKQVYFTSPTGSLTKPGSDKETDRIVVYLDGGEKSLIYDIPINDGHLFEIGTHTVTIHQFRVNEHENGIAPIKDELLFSPITTGEDAVVVSDLLLTFNTTSMGFSLPLPAGEQEESFTNKHENINDEQIYRRRQGGINAFSYNQIAEETDMYQYAKKMIVKVATGTTIGIESSAGWFTPVVSLRTDGDTEIRLGMRANLRDTWREVIMTMTITTIGGEGATGSGVAGTQVIEYLIRQRPVGDIQMQSLTIEGGKPYADLKEAFTGYQYPGERISNIVTVTLINDTTRSYDIWRNSGMDDDFQLLEHDEKNDATSYFDYLKTNIKAQNLDLTRLNIKNIPNAAFAGHIGLTTGNFENPNWMYPGSPKGFKYKSIRFQRFANLDDVLEYMDPDKTGPTWAYAIHENYGFQAFKYQYELTHPFIPLDLSADGGTRYVKSLYGFCFSNMLDDHDFFLEPRTAFGTLSSSSTYYPNSEFVEGVFRTKKIWLMDKWDNWLDKPRPEYLEGEKTDITIWYSSNYSNHKSAIALDIILTPQFIVFGVWWAAYHDESENYEWYDGWGDLQKSDYNSDLDYYSIQEMEYIYAMAMGGAGYRININSKVYSPISYTGNTGFLNGYTKEGRYTIWYTSNKGSIQVEKLVYYYAY